jgi:hypothetical protein
MRAQTMEGKEGFSHEIGWLQIKPPTQHVNVKEVKQARKSNFSTQPKLLSTTSASKHQTTSNHIKPH